VTNPHLRITFRPRQEDQCESLELAEGTTVQQIIERFAFAAEALPSGADRRPLRAAGRRAR
jgi:hypothetical protein